jgi:hypothetical protein
MTRSKHHLTALRGACVRWRRPRMTPCSADFLIPFAAHYQVSFKQTTSGPTSLPDLTLLKSCNTPTPEPPAEKSTLSDRPAHPAGTFGWPELKAQVDP